MRRIGATRAVAALVAGLMALSVPGSRGAWAQGSSASPASEAAKEEAARLYTAGMTAVEAKDWAKARDLLDRAFKAHKHWKIAVNLGRVEVELNRSRDAAEHLEYFLKNADPNAVLPTDRQKVLDLLNLVRLKVATVTVTVDVAGADVIVDGKLVGKSPLLERIFVEPGKHVVEAKLEGYRPAQEPMDLTAGVSREVIFEMVRGSGVGGAPKGNSGGRAKGGGEEGVEEDVTGYGPTKYPDGAREKPVWQTSIMWAGAGLALAGAGIGVAFVFLGNGKDSEGVEKVDDLKVRTRSNDQICASNLTAQQLWRRDECAAINTLIKERDTFHTVSVVGFAVGGVAAAAAVTFALLPAPKASSKASVRVVPAISGSSGGALVVGTF